MTGFNRAEAVGRRIKERRKSLGLSAEDVAAKMNVSPATIYRYESAAIANMGIDKLDALAEALETSPEYLMGWTDESPSIPSSSYTYNSEPTFGERLRFVRNKRGLTQEELANLLNTSKQVISRYESNQRIPKITTLKEYAEKLHVPMEELIASSEDYEQNQLITFDDFTYAMHNEAKDLSPENKQKLLELAQFFKEQQQKEGGGENK